MVTTPTEGVGSSTSAPGWPGDPEVTRERAREHKLTEAEYDAACARLGRAPSWAELGVLSVMWSEHCSYKSSRIHLRRLPTTGPRVVQGPGENAGVVDVGDGFGVCFKMESHNHPSYIEPYQGAATGVGGILRDVFTMGARPIAILDSLRFGRPDHPKTPSLLRGVVSGIAGYGNCIGVPTVGGELFFDPAYDGNCLVNAFAAGIVPNDRIFYGRASGVGNPVLYVGARTGRDGIHGATMASDEFSEGGPSQRPTVQVGDPFLEKLLLEACLEIFAADLLVGVQDMGAAGLTSSSVEMASRSGSGLDLDLDKIPRRTRGLLPYEMLLSESQERMLMVAKPGHEDRVVAICQKWELDAVVVGHVTDTGRWVVRATPGYDPYVDSTPPAGARSVVVCDLPVDFLVEDAPRYDRPQADDPRLPARLAFDPNAMRAPRSWDEAVLSMVGSPNVGSRRWIWRQYDHIVRGGTRVRPGNGDAGVVRVPCERDGVHVVDKLLAFACDANGRLGELDAFEGGAQAVAETCRNLVCVGAEPVGLTDCLNFGSPERPEIMRQLARAIDGIAAACRELGVPVVSGNVSLYNETNGRAILPTPTIGGVGLIADPGDVVGAAFPARGLTVLLLGPGQAGPLGGSTWVCEREGESKGEPPRIDLAMEAKLQRLLLQLVRSRPRFVLSMHDVSEGGLAACLAECCVARDDVAADVGLNAELPPTDESNAAALFGEAPSRVVISCDETHAADLMKLAEDHGVPAWRIGTTGGDRLVVHRARGPLVDLPIAELREARDRCLDRILER